MAGQMTDDLDALLAALDHEIEERQRANPYKDDEERLVALKRFIAETRTRPRTFNPLSKEDEDLNRIRARALVTLLERMQVKNIFEEPHRL